MTRDPLDIVLLDTDVFSYLMEPGDRRGQPYLRHVQGRVVALSFITVGELLFGASRRAWGQKRTDDLQRRLQRAFILPFDQDVCSAYAHLKTDLWRQGQILADNDRGDGHTPLCAAGIKQSQAFRANLWIGSHHGGSGLVGTSIHVSSKM